MREYSIVVEASGYSERIKADNAVAAIRKFIENNGKLFFDDMIYLLVSRIETKIVIRFVVNSIKGKVTKIEMENVVG